MTKFEVIQSITGVNEFSKIVFDLAKKAGTPEALEEDLRTDVSAEGLKTLKSIAQRGNYPLSFEGKQ